MTTDELLKGFNEAIARANDKFEKLKINAETKYNNFKLESIKKTEELNDEISNLKNELNNSGSDKEKIQELENQILSLKKQNEKIITLQEQIEKLQIENEQKVALEREITKLRNENTRVVEEYRAWRERLKTLIKKMGLF